ncbi:cysteine hydrolase [Sedimentibacter hydroxybenzoicus DSM 7310]|uniref:Cysteine hydrolase n=1 Tax=Sedimentibacter hydroxybenzoicus DSM 7310 TaxID=1123245 RepID=A0A974BK09_SEDHY|nr:isochorismatase family cysteine hydrolase [Sedimentibacter hydroxybenzoicus]NYB74075.1 cysteine hydrolase [Sedimentibacter hydroxybenzoicus DSM 7310]
MKALEAMEKEIRGKTIELHSLNKDRTSLFVVDMIVGFVHSGIMSSPRVASIVNNITELNEKLRGYKKVFFLDAHEEDAQEFRSYPKHCVIGTEEAELIPELRTEYSEGLGTVYINKNSTNGFLSDEFQKWLKKNESEIDNYIITGCVTDICVMQFALSLKAYFNENNKNKRVIVPINSVETYDGGSHDGGLMNQFALYNMHINGIEVVENIK